MYRIAVLSSSNGTDLQAIIDEMKAGTMLGVELAVVISDKKDSYALRRAHEQGYETHFLNPKGKSREEYDAELSSMLIQRKVDLVVLAGYMRIISNPLLIAFPRRIINIHPSLVPKYCGPGMFGDKVHEAVIKNKDTETGCTIHFVDAGVDSGEIIMQKRAEVTEEDTIQTVKEKVQKLEKKFYPEVIRRFADGQIK